MRLGQRWVYPYVCLLWYQHALLGYVFVAPAFLAPLC